jgi:hypothetical protein
LRDFLRKDSPESLLRHYHEISFESLRRHAKNLSIQLIFKTRLEQCLNNGKFWVVGGWYSEIFVHLPETRAEPCGRMGEATALVPNFKIPSLNSTAVLAMKYHELDLDMENKMSETSATDLTYTRRHLPKTLSTRAQTVSVVTANTGHI